MHGLPVLGLVIPLFNVLAPIFLGIHTREDSPVYNRHGRAIINCQITINLIFISAFIALLIVEGYGALIFIAVIPFALITMLVNIFLILRGRNYFYPISIPFLSNGKSNTTTIKVFMVILTMTFVKNICQSQSNTTITRLDGSKISASELSAKIR